MYYPEYDTIKRIVIITALLGILLSLNAPLHYTALAALTGFALATLINRNHEDSHDS